MSETNRLSGSGPRRRALLGLGAAAGAAAVLPATAAPAAARGKAPRPGFAAAFASPGRAVRPKFRWWWPDGLVDPAEIAREVDQIADAGFGGVEIAAVTHSLSEPIDAERHGWGTAAWVAGLESALRRADRRGLTVDVTIGPAWPAAVPTVTPDSAAAARELAHGLAVIQGAEGSYAGPVPPPVVPAAEGVTDRRLLWVQAARIGAAGAAPAPLQLDRESVTDLTALVRDGALQWTAPDAGQWALISYWERGSGQRPEGPAHTSPLSYVVDHFSAAGTRAVTDFWERRILTRRVRGLLRRAGGALFEDSLEIETDATLWTPGLAEEFERRIGRPLLPYLAAVIEKDEKYVFSFDAATNKAVRRDYMQVITDLYLEHHLLPLREWAHSLGLALRVQPYGLETDAIHSASLLDIPEGESLGFKNLDDFRCLAGGRDMGGGRVLSNEAGATAGGAYATTWDATLRKLVTQYCAGVNQAVIHGFGYATAPGAAWPGFAAFSPYHGGPGYGEAWGPRTPAWRHVPDVAGYLGRIQGVLQSGTHRVDVAVLRQKGYAGSGLGAPWFTPEGVPLGWTHTFLSPRSLGLPSAVVRGGRLAPDGPAFKVLVLEGDVMIGREHTLELECARRLIELAEDGLPMIVVGDWSDGHVPGLPHEGDADDDRLRALITRLLAVPGVRRVADRPDIPAALEDLGIEPDVAYAARSPLLHAHRAGPDVAYHFFANGSATEAADHEVAIVSPWAKATPYALDAWTGEVAPVAVHRDDGGRVTLRVTLAPGATALVALARGAAPRHVLSTEAESARVVDGVLEVLDTRPGARETVLSDGRKVVAHIAGLPAPLTVDRWSLRVADWRPGRSPDRHVTVDHRLDPGALAAWPDLPGLEDVSGVGRYRATVRLGRGWTGATGVRLELGEVFDTFRVAVNGTAVGPVDQVTGVVDLGGLLRHGENTIEVEVATTLLNRLRTVRPAEFGAAGRQRYGLIGPVRLVPYGRAVVSAD